VDRGGEGRWVGSVGHDEMLRLTDLRDVFEDEDPEVDAKEDRSAGESSDDEDGREDKSSRRQLMAVGTADSETEKSPGGDGKRDAEKAPDAEDSDAQDSDVPKQKKRQKKQKGPLGGQKKSKGKNEIDADPSFFSGL